MTDTLKKFILQLSAEAGEYLRNNFYTIKNTTQLDVKSYVTNVEVDLEETLLRRISQAFPDHGITMNGEEKKVGAGEYCWLVDPLDGSLHFARNIPLYTCNVAVQKNNETILAAVNHPQAHQLFFAEQGSGAYLNGIQIGVSSVEKLDDALIYVELPERKFARQPDEQMQFDRSMKILGQLIQHAGQVETFRIGALGQCLVAAGAFDAYLDFSGSSLKVAQEASLLIAREAGAVVTSIKSFPTDSEFVQVMVCNEKLAENLKNVTRSM